MIAHSIKYLLPRSSTRPTINNITKVRVKIKNNNKNISNKITKAWHKIAIMKHLNGKKRETTHRNQKAQICITSSNNNIPRPMAL